MAVSCAWYVQTPFRERPSCKQVTIWQSLHSPISSSVRSFTEAPNHILHSGTMAEVYKSEGNDKSWKPAGLYENVKDELLVPYKGTILAGTCMEGILSSVDEGKNWTLIGFGRNPYVFNIVQDSSSALFAAATFIIEGFPDTTATGVFKLIDDGKTWQQTAIKDLDIGEISNPKPELLFASSRTKFYRSIDNGTTWNQGGKGLPDSPSGAILAIA